MEQDRTISATRIVDLASLRREVEVMEGGSAWTQQAEDEFTRFFAQSLDLLCIAGFDGYFKRLNPAWTTRLGWTVEELQTRPFIDFVHPDDRAATLAEVAKLAGGAETIMFENRYYHQDGSYRWLRWNSRPVRGRRRIYAIARDVTRQKQLERELLNIADQEKERLGRELHDGLCQTLAGIAALGSTLSRQLETNTDVTASAAAAEIARLLNDAVGEARNLARGLGPLGLDTIGLYGALETLALNIQNLFRVTCTLTCERPLLQLNREVEAQLFRIVQEAVNNAVVHGHAEQIDISLISRDGEGILSIRDDGVGMSGAVRDSDGIGLHTMSYRSRLIGGRLGVRRRAHRGTAVICVFPLPATYGTHETPDHARNDA